MGNYVCAAGRRPVEERLTRPQRQILRQPSDFDLKKLRKLIRSHKLAPCFDALDEPHHLPDLEECPICFFYFPSLNRSSCCYKGICTECFLQMLPPDATRSVRRCPFCKTSCFAVEYRGARTKQEKDLEEVEEQKVIEAKIRMQHQTQTVEQILPSENTRSIFEVQYTFLNLKRGPADNSSV